MSNEPRIGLTRDLLTSEGTPSFGEKPLSALGGLPWEWLAEDVAELTPEIAARYDALCVNLPLVTAATVERSDCRLRIVARHGVGYDSVDVDALTRAGIVLTNTPMATRRPVATAAITYMLALAQKLRVKDRLTRAGGWNSRTDHMGTGLTGRTLGIVGAGRIGTETLRLAKVFDLKLLAADPYVASTDMAALGAELVPLDTLLRRADFVVVTCLLTKETHHLISTAQFALMKPTAYLINVARGPIVDQQALVAALEEGRIAGAGIDVFEQEPPDAANPLLRMENTIVTPHALCWTDECFDGIASSALSEIAAAMAGRRPTHVVNPDVLDHPRVRAWLRDG